MFYFFPIFSFEFVFAFLHSSILFSPISFGFGSFIFGLAINRLFHYLCDLAVPGAYVNNTFYGDYNNIGATWELFARYGVIAWVVGISLLILAYELIIRKTKYVLILIQIFFIIFLSHALYIITKITSFVNLP